MIKHLVLITAIALINICHAQYAATDLSYTCLGAGKYRVKLDVYTECKTNGSMIDRNIFPLFVSSQKLKITIPNVFFERVSATDHVRLFCKSEGDVCGDVNSPNRGLRLATFFATLDLSAYPPTDDWEASFIRDSKDEVFTHLVSPGDYAHIATVNINTSISPCNNSPSFSSRPILKACNQKTDTLNLGITDVDKDELRFSFSNPVTIFEREVRPMTYQSGFSPTKPLNLGSDLKITPDGKLIVVGNQHLDVGATDLIIDEYRNGQKIGSTRRNLQINVLNCVNQKPSVSTFATPMNANKRTELTICSGDTIPKLNSLINISDVDHVIDSLPITYSDERLKDIFKIEGLNTNKVSIYANRSPVFSTATDVQITMHVKAYDNGCPIREFDEETFTIFVKAKPTFDFAYDKAFLNCNPPTVLNPHNIPDLNTEDTTKPKNVIGNDPFTYKWKIWNKTSDDNYYVVNPNVYTNSQASHTVDVNNHGVTLQVTDVNGCSAKDSIYFENGLEFNLDATLRCFGNDSTVIRDLSKSHDTLSPIVKRTWDFGDGDLLSGNDSIVKKKYCKEGLYKISLEVETRKGCKAKFDDSLRIYSLPEPNFDVETKCMNRMIINNLSTYLNPLSGGTEDLKSTPYGIQYFATKVYSGKDSSVEVKVQTRASVHVVCDTIIVRFDTDSAAANCSVYNVAPAREYGFNYTRLPNRPLSNIFRVTEDANMIYFHFKPFEFQTTYLDTALLATSEILMSIPKTAILNRHYADFDTLIQDKKTNLFKKGCKTFVKEDQLSNDLLIRPHVGTTQPNDYIFPNLTFDWEKQNNRIQVDSGIYLIKQVITTGQCRKEVLKEVTVYAEPQIDISNAAGDILVSDTLIRNCSGGDTTLYAKALKDPNGGLRYRWLHKPNEDDIDSPPIFTNSAQASASEPGTYVLYVQDSRTCDDTTRVTLTEYLNVDFDVFSDCDIHNDTLKFKNWSDYGKGPKIKSSQWYLHNTSRSFDTSFTEADTAFSRVIRHKGELIVTLVVTDSLNCQKAVTDSLMRSNFVDSLTLALDSTDASFCVSDKINAHAIRLIGDHNQIDSIVWFPGDGRRLVQRGGKRNSDLEGFSFTYPNDSSYTVSYIAYFDGVSRTVKDKANKDSLIIVKPSCSYKSDSTQKINIKPEFKGKLFKFRTCIPDTVEFIFEKDPRIGDNTSKVKTIKWHVDTRSTETEPKFDFPIQDTNVYSFKKEFTKQHDLLINFSARDDNGCLFHAKEEAEVKAMDKPAVFGMDSVCLGTESSIRIRHKDGKGGGTIRYSVDYLNTQVAYNQFVTKNNTETVKYTFPYPGVAPIRVSAHFPSVYENSIHGEMRAECRGVIDTSIYIKPYPTPFFTAPPECTGTDTTIFTNETKFWYQTNNAKDSTIVAYIWDFGDGTPKSNVEHPRHVYATGGDKQVKLIAVAANGCTADTTIDVGTKLSPTSYFTMDRDSTLINFNDPITFYEKAEPDEIVRYEWDFGDGEKQEGRDGIVHQYKNIDRFEVSLKVTNNNGCTDIYTKTAELKPILLLPNVFSPNEDGQNDELFLIYRLIDELEDFKIYNRWGEVVFDAKGNLKARWDGKYKGTDQELGVYVAYVKAKGKYGYNYNFKQNITLLR